MGRARSSGVEHLTFNQRADGSIPSGLTTEVWNYSGVHPQAAGHAELSLAVTKTTDATRAQTLRQTP